MIKYFLYIRKSTDEDDRQVLSLESQETELLELAQKERLDIVEIFRESQTAKEPGRKIFNQMLEKMERDEAQGILAWHPDRLARNSVDGGKIIFLVDSNKIQSLKFPTFWFEPTPQGKFMLNIAFGQSKYFVDNLSENTKRGLRQKLRRGEWPGWAPIGYLNDLRTHTIIPDPERFRLVKKLFELYSVGNYSLKDLQNQNAKIGLLSKVGKTLSISMIQHTLENPFYYGLMKYNNELHQGKHKPMISKKLFEKCQKISKDRTRPRKQSFKEYAFRGLLKCADCGCSITSEIQKGHTYYRCTKKRMPCSQSYIREENLAEQISKILQKVSLGSAWAKKMISHLDKEKESNQQAELGFTQNLKSQVEDCKKKLDKLLDAHLENIISKDEYTAKKQKILNQKVEISEKLRDFEQKPFAGCEWLELCRNFILSAQQARIIALQKNFFEKRNFLKKIGSNPLLHDKKVLFNPREAWKILPNFNAEAQRAEANINQYPIWLRG
ncbi:recombinase family protein [Patescibacteria group bacterium]|nr:recombinase family protein [Patescibacteria group bacterium]